jgi:GT2 family glycosyltransferase
MADSPRVSVILVNYKGVEDTLTAIDYLTDLPEYPTNLEIVVVDNASDDGSLQKLRAREKDIVLVASPTKLWVCRRLQSRRPEGIWRDRGVLEQ